MLRSLIHHIVAIPFVYNCAQFVLGGRIMQKKFEDLCDGLQFGDGWVLDYAGGTGRSRPFLDKAKRYLLMDIDMVKIEGYKTKFDQDYACLCDVTAPPIQSNSADIIFARNLLHHLTTEQMDEMFEAIPRLLKSNGTLVITEPLANSSRWIGRLLWRYDRGDYPKTIDMILERIKRSHTISHIEECTVLHDYLIVVAKPNLRI